MEMVAQSRLVDAETSAEEAILEFWLERDGFGLHSEALHGFDVLLRSRTSTKDTKY